MRSAACLLCAMSAFAQSPSVPECTFQRNPDELLTRQLRAHRQAFDTTTKFTTRAAKGSLRNLQPSAAPRRNLIDEYVFTQLEERGIDAAPISTDEEFLRRVTLDLTGRIPSPADIRAFLASEDPGKRDQVIEKLLASDEFIDKWTMWFGDLLKNNSFPSNFDRQLAGRNAYYVYMRDALKSDKSLKTFAYDLVTGFGNHFDQDYAAAANYPIASKTSMGPIQDTYDTMLSMTASTFLGLGEMDCLLCHNGRGHLEQVNLWASKKTRYEAWRMAAFFSRLNMPQRNVPSTDKYYRSYDVNDRTSGTYDLNTNWGNRPNRDPVAGIRNLTPEYIDTASAPKDGAWRIAFAEMMVQDPMFARNFANRLWKEMFNLALAEPVDSLDPARLDPKNPPAEPWTLQASHPELLEQLAAFLKSYDYNLRGFLRTITQSTTYQLSTRYEGEWKYDYITSFGRHYPRRMMAEEIHDAVVKATGVTASYTVTGFTQPLNWAMQLPEPAEPRSNGAVATFLNFFLRGNRDSQQRSSSQSLLQHMYLMNDSLVNNRTRITSSPNLTAVSKMSSDDEAVDELHLLFLSRMPTENERKTTAALLAAAKDTAARNAAIEDIAWALIQKPEFLFSY
ncbi:MAG: DUF1549 domain-containing protein [Acidobacteria bacterium]|nr:DUF1549 domain-containing protein [Acidobacteriota bacterium]